MHISRYTSARTIYRHRQNWFFVLDFESTCDTKAKSGLKAEIIKAQTGEIVDEFHKYVRPTENPILSNFCKKLTGISQECVDASSDLQQVLKEFELWLKTKKKELKCTFKVDCPNAAVFVTWTDWDIRTCLWNECQRKHLSLPVDFLTRIDLKAVFKQWHASTNLGNKCEFQGRLQDAITAAGLTFRGRPHSGIDDAHRSSAKRALKVILGAPVQTVSASDICSEERKLSVIAKNFIKNKEQFNGEELRALSVELLNSFLRRDVSSDYVKFSNDLTVDMDTYFSLMQNMMCAIDGQSIRSLEDFFSKFIDYIASRPRAIKTEIQFAQFCIFSWQECFVYQSQQLLGDIISNLLINKIAAFLSWYSQADKAMHDNLSVCLHSIVLVSIFRLVGMLLLNRLTPSNIEIGINKKVHPNKSNLNDLGRIYEQSFESLSDSTVVDPILQIDNLESFLSDAFKLFMHFCGSNVAEAFSFPLAILQGTQQQDREIRKRIAVEEALRTLRKKAVDLMAYEKVTLRELAFDELVPKIQNDPTLYNRLTLGYASFLAQFLTLLPEMGHILADSDLSRLQQFVQNLLSVSGQIPDQSSHTDLISWNIDRGLCVKDYALAFLRNSMFDDALCSSKVLPRLIRQVSFLTEDSDVAMAVIRKLNYLRSKMLPFSSHEDLLKELMSVLSSKVKTEILDQLQNKFRRLITPLPSEENKFRSYLRTFFNRLSAGPGVSDYQPASKMSKLWRDNALSNTVSKEILLSADMLLLTRPLEFLLELVRFPIIQNSMALLPVLYKILNHVSYAFTININGNHTSILHNLMVSLLEMFDSDVSETREDDDSLRGENRQRMELMCYLPRSGDLDPGQISLANQAAKFSFYSTSASAGFDLTDNDGDNSGGGGEDSMVKSAVRKLWVYVITRLLDQTPEEEEKKLVAQIMGFVIESERRIWRSSSSRDEPGFK
ncbi:hypothetical protein ACTXT7_015985 [Hymenolepis weldensis]